MDNIRNRADIKLVNNKRKAEKFVPKPNFKHLTIFDDILASIHMNRTKLKFDKPVYCGMAILDLSKTWMHDFHYNYIKKKYPQRSVKTSFLQILICFVIKLRLMTFSKKFLKILIKNLTRAIFLKITNLKFQQEKKLSDER